VATVTTLWRDTTTFEYTLSNPSAHTLYRVIVGVDLSKAEVVAATPEQSANVKIGFGFRNDSYVSGIVWSFENGYSATTGTFTFTLQGKWNTNLGDIYYQLQDAAGSIDEPLSYSGEDLHPNTTGNDCHTETIQGPTTRDSDSCNVISGRVGVFGLLHSTFNTAWTGQLGGGAARGH